MRIILVQAEIEEAIKAYVCGQINIRDGQNITIDFKNTRGDDGATAEINISQPKSTNAEQVAKALAGTEVEPVDIPAASPEAPVATERLNISTGEERVDPTDQASMPQYTPEAEVPIAAPEPKEEEPAAASPATPGPKSLFANLTKPKHDPQPE